MGCIPKAGETLIGQTCLLALPMGPGERPALAKSHGLGARYPQKKTEKEDEYREGKNNNRLPCLLSDWATLD